jgi:hypothetical protein
VLILNDDAILQKDSLGLMVQRLDSEPRIAAVRPRLLNPDGSLQRGFTNRSFPHLVGVLAQILLVEELFERRRWTRKLLTMSRDPDLGGRHGTSGGSPPFSTSHPVRFGGLFDEAFHRSKEGQFHLVEGENRPVQLPLPASRLPVAFWVVGWYVVCRAGAHIGNSG